MTNLRDGLGTANLNILETGSIATLVAGIGQISATEIGSGAILPAHVGSGLAIVHTGSPAANAPATIEYGTGTLSAASVLVVAFGSPFAATPLVYTTNTKTLGAISAGSINAGSFSAWGTTAADTFNWIAIGKR